MSSPNKSAPLGGAPERSGEAPAAPKKAESVIDISHIKFYKVEVGGQVMLPNNSGVSIIPKGEVLKIADPEELERLQNADIVLKEVETPRWFREAQKAVAPEPAPIQRAGAQR